MLCSLSPSLCPGGLCVSLFPAGEPPPRPPQPLILLKSKWGCFPSRCACPLCSLLVPLLTGTGGVCGEPPACPPPLPACLALHTHTGCTHRVPEGSRRLHTQLPSRVDNDFLAEMPPEPEVFPPEGSASMQPVGLLPSFKCGAVCRAVCVCVFTLLPSQ